MMLNMRFWSLLHTLKYLIKINWFKEGMIHDELSPIPCWDNKV